MKYFRVKNLEKYQHYKDRNPSWIKLQTSLLNDVEFCLLTDIQQLTFIKLILLSSQNRNRLAFDSRSLRHRLGITSRIDLKVFVNNDMIEIIEDTPENASTLLAPRREENIKNINQNKNICLNEENPSAKPSHNFTELDLNKAIQMRSDIHRIRPGYKFTGSIKSEANILRLLREIDKRPDWQVDKVWKWAIDHHFWGKNIRSPSKLRKQFDRLLEEMEGELNKKPEKSTFEKQRDVIDDWAKTRKDNNSGGIFDVDTKSISARD